MKRTILAVLTAVVCAAAQSAPKKAQKQLPQEMPAANRQALWKEDLEFFAKHFSNGHCTPADFWHEPLLVFQPCHQADFGKLYRPPDFFNEIHTIEESISTLTDAQIVLRLARLVAAGHVGHTYVQLPLLRLGFSLVPLGFRWYSDGLAITQATPQYSEALGARVLRIGKLSADEALAAIAPYISCENQNWLRTASLTDLTRMPVLQQIGAADANGNIVFTLSRDGGEPFTLPVRKRDPRVKLDDVFTAHNVPAGIAGKHRDTLYSFEYLSDTHSLYIQYNSCENDPKLSFGKFTDQVLAFADSHTVERAIIDLRFNGGGNSLIIHPLKGGLRSRHFPLFVLIGDGTFSSAQDNAIAMRRQNNATLVGIPTGERPNGYGEVRALRLPHSGLHVQYSTEYFHMMKGSDPDALYPDIMVPTTLADALAGRDPVLETALHAKPRGADKH